MGAVSGLAGVDLEESKAGGGFLLGDRIIARTPGSARTDSSISILTANERLALCGIDIEFGDAHDRFVAHFVLPFTLFLVSARFGDDAG